jgi:phage shock protein C
MTKRLYRSRKDKVVAGVCSGIAQYLKVDPVLVRLGFVALAVLENTGIGLLVYLAAMFIVPVQPTGIQDDSSDDPTEPEVVNYSGETGHSSPTLGIILIGLGAGLMLDRFGLPHLRLLDWQWPFVSISLWPLALILLGSLWPLALILLGILVVVKQSGKHN